MGGKSKTTTQQQTTPTQTPQSTQAFGGATNIAGYGSGLAQKMGNLLWGDPSAKGSTGSLSGFLDPSKLNVSSPTGPFALQFTKQKEQLAKGYQDANSATQRNLAQSGFGPGTPSGFGASLQAENARGLANSVGNAYADQTTNSYNDALNNFWKATGAAGQTGQAGANLAAQTYNNLYGRSLGQSSSGTSTQTQPWTSVFSPIAGAAGTVGAAAMCCAVGTRIHRSHDTWSPIERLQHGLVILGVEGPLRLIAKPECSEQPCVRIVGENAAELICSRMHTLLRPGGGYVVAEDALGQEVLTYEGKTRITEVADAGTQTVVRLKLDGSHTFLSNGFFSEE